MVTHGDLFEGGFAAANFIILPKVNNETGILDIGSGIPRVPQFSSTANRPSFVQGVGRNASRRLLLTAYCRTLETLTGLPSARLAGDANGRTGDTPACVGTTILMVPSGLKSMASMQACRWLDEASV